MGALAASTSGCGVRVGWGATLTRMMMMRDEDMKRAEVEGCNDAMAAVWRAAPRTKCFFDPSEALPGADVPLDALAFGLSAGLDGGGSTSEAAAIPGGGQATAAVRRRGRAGEGQV